MRKRVFWVAVAGIVAVFAPLAFAADLLVSNVGGNTVLRYNGQTGALVGQFVTAGSGGLSAPWGVVFGPDGISTSAAASTTTFSATTEQTGQFVNTFVTAGSGGLDFPVGLAFGPAINHLYVANGFAANSSVRRYDGPTGAFINAFVPGGIGGLLHPSGVVFGPDGNLYVVSRDSPGVPLQRLDRGLHRHLHVRGGLNDPVGVTFGPDGNLYVASRVTDNVLRFNGQTGAFLDDFVPEASGGLQDPHGLVFGPGWKSVRGQPGDVEHPALRRPDRCFPRHLRHCGQRRAAVPDVPDLLPIGSRLRHPDEPGRLFRGRYRNRRVLATPESRPGSRGRRDEDLAGRPQPGPTSVVNAGADGSLTLAAGFDQEFGPIDLFVVRAGFPSGTYEFSCRLLDPITGQTKHEDLNPFEIP